MRSAEIMRVHKITFEYSEMSGGNFIRKISEFETQLLIFWKFKILENKVH